MRRIQIRIDERDSYRLDMSVEKFANDVQRLLWIKWLFDAPITENTLTDFQPQRARHQRRQAIPRDVVDVWPFLPAHFQLIAKAFGGNQAGHRSLILNDC